MNDSGIKKFLDMQKRLYVDTVKSLGYKHAKNLVGHPRSWDDKLVEHRVQSILHDYHDGRILEYGCGVGRLMRFIQAECEGVDGVDLSSEMLICAQRYLNENDIPNDKYTLNKCDGYTLSSIPNSTYGLVYSVSVFQHISVHEIRLNLLREFFRVLKPEGAIFLQVNSGLEFNDDVQAVRYHQNYYSAPFTNSIWDVKIENPLFLIDELYEIGFKCPNLTFISLPPNSTKAKAEYQVHVRAKK